MTTPSGTTDVTNGTTYNRANYYYYNGIPRGTRPFVDVPPYTAFTRSPNFLLISVPVFAAITGLIAIIIFITHSEHCCCGLFEEYKVKLSKKRKSQNIWNRIFRCGRRTTRQQHGDLTYCACDEFEPKTRRTTEFTMESEVDEDRKTKLEREVRQRIRDKSIHLLTEEEIRATFKECECDTMYDKEEFKPGIRNVMRPDQKGVTFMIPGMSPADDDFGDVADFGEIEPREGSNSTSSDSVLTEILDRAG